ncbi:MAG: cysteine synthase family protein [Lachnospira sp.]|nr:cysteine synthase family protein [Lachnospira sp.]
MKKDIIQKFGLIEAMVGRTPLVAIHYSYKGRKRTIYAKVEYYNYSGSIKDRVAYYILKKAYEQDMIQPEDVIAEATSGNTGIAFSAMGRFLGHPVVIYMPDWMSKERIQIMESFGAKVELVSRQEGGFLGSIAKTEELYKQGNVFLPRQFSNEDNINTHIEMTGEEIALQLSALGKTADGVVAGVGTGGTIMGIARRLRRDNPNCKAYPLEPLSSPTLSTGNKVGQHKIQGISDEFIPEIVKLKELDDVVSVSDSDAIIMARMLSEQLGLGVGISSGANFVGAVMAQNKLSDDSTVVTVFADDNKKYLSTEYVVKQEVMEGDLTPDITLLGMESYRMCSTI